MINNVVLMGRLTSDPELKQTSNGKNVTNFCVAVDKFKREDGADFINCTAWDQTASFISKYFAKGSMIAVAGSISTRKYTDKEGNNRTSFEIVVREASFCGGKNENDAPKKPQEKVDAVVDDSEVEEIDDDEDLPF